MRGAVVGGIVGEGRTDEVVKVGGHGQVKHLGELHAELRQHPVAGVGSLVGHKLAEEVVARPRVRKALVGEVKIRGAHVPVLDLAPVGVFKVVS